MLIFTSRGKLTVRLTILLLLTLFALFYTSCRSSQSFNQDLDAIVKPYTFSILQWELNTLPAEISRSFFTRHENVTDEAETVTDYFSRNDQIKALQSTLRTADNDERAALEAELAILQEQQATAENKVERVIEQQLSEILAEQGIIDTSNGPGQGITLPPVNFQLATPPYLLVVSSRDRIDYIRGINLKQDITTTEITAIEAQVDELGVSSLVVPLGGLGATYPSFVTNNASLQFTINAATEEWLHQYLTFRPLGFRYLLHVTDIAKDYQVVTINETVANMVSDEIGAILCQKYYQGCANTSNDEDNGEGFDFNAAMREIRITVDQYLADGEVALAEEFMEQQRQYLLTKGYYIRKLNQAYFAFYGTYADSPTSVSPIGQDLRTLREQSSSLKEFLDTAAGITSYQDLLDSINEADTGG